jgi:hypothetical protein
MRAAPNKVTPSVVNGPRDCVSVDQLISLTPSLIAQITVHGRNGISQPLHELSFVYMQKDTKGPKKSHGVLIQHYHADNGHFREKTWLDHYEEKQQSVSFCSANAHFQNSIAEKRIQDLQDLAWTMLVHTKHHWPKAINAHLWPYADYACTH